ncbi:hypothetical protein BBJ29_006266 [Phytophthora kernoviae]|uniref:Transmembrane protein n=1 Tax=Phytophthora kernoviae TaxID=325452 RepID=A0A3F2RFQ9_9STRA|nr:hypothetical protein BBJ29_006266 [Phytophthora kernoviae]RLN55455.1 hypothetical protein BBP00_00008474 [Phytophthora kernoviae]
MAPHRKKKPPTQSLRAQAEAKAEVQAAERRQLDLDRMSSYSDDAFECESPHAILASSRGIRPEHRSDFHEALYEETETSGDNAGGHPKTSAASPYLVVDNIGRLRVDSTSESDNHDDVAYGELAQPRPEIILRWKRFAFLVVLTAAVMSAIAAWLREGFVVYQAVAVKDAEDKADTVNSYIGLIMGFIESLVGLGVEEIFPVFIVYLHNLRWYPGDDPATKKQGKFKKFALTIFIPAVMMAVGSSLSAIQANQQDDSVSTTNSTSSNNTAIATRHLQQDVVELEGEILRNSILKAALARKVDPMPPLDAYVCSEQESTAYLVENLLSAAPKAVFGFPLPEWGAEFGNAWYREASTKRYNVMYSGAETTGGDVALSAVMPLATAYELWMQGSTLLRKSLRSTRQTKEIMPSSSVGGFLEGVLASLRAMGLPLTASAAVNASFETLAHNSLMNLDAMTLQIPLLNPDQASRFATIEHLTEPLSQSTNPCSSAMDTYLRYVNSNHFYIDGDMLDTMAASALLFIFQNARVLDAAPGEGITATQRRLADTGRRVKVFLSNTSIGNACTWTGCGVLLVLTILALVLPNERARLSPPRGGNARAERFVAVQTEQIYPNLIYKKRFLIGKTGEEIKFGEFAVESVGLHHKMEEDEQIYI